MIAVNHRRHKQFRLANLVQKLLVCNALQGHYFGLLSIRCGFKFDVNGGNMTAKTESDDSDIIRSWEPHAIIYEHDSRSFEAYLVLEGEVEVFAPLGLKLNTIGQGEIFGEASLLLNTKRSDCAGWQNAGESAQNSP